MSKSKLQIPAPGRLYHFAEQDLTERWAFEAHFSRYGWPSKEPQASKDVPSAYQLKKIFLTYYVCNRSSCILLPLDPESYASLVDSEHELFGDNPRQILHWHSKWPYAVWLDCKTEKVICGS